MQSEAWVFFQAIYKEDYGKNKGKNTYKITDTEQYKTIKDGEKALSDVRPILILLHFTKQGLAIIERLSTTLQEVESCFHL